MKFSNDKILEYIDGNLSSQERNEIQHLIDTDPEFRKRHEAFKSLDTTMQSNKFYSPSSNFVNEVMKSILRPTMEQGKFFNKTRYFVLGLIVIAFFSTIYFLTINYYPSLSGLLVDQVTISNQTVNLKPASNFLSNEIIFKIVLYVNGIVALFLFERAFLRPLFSRRKQRFSM